MENGDAHSGGQFFVRRNRLILGPKMLAEEIPRLPLRTLWVLRDVISHQEIDLHELHCGVEVQWLIHIVRRSVVVDRDPFAP